MGIFPRILQKVHQLYQGLLGLVLSCHIRKGNPGILLHIHLGSAFAHSHDSSAHALHHKVHENYNDHKRNHKT